MLQLSETLSDLRLKAGTVHIVLIPLDQNDERTWSRYYGLLDEEERIRAQAFIRPELAQRYITAHGAMRIILGHMAGSNPARLVIIRSRLGKPSLAGALGEQLRFNLTHSHEAALLAVCTGREVGVDIERLRPVPEYRDLACRFFHASEAWRLSALSSDRADTAFLRTWVRKEAYLKARGVGLAVPLDSFEVQVDPSGPASLLWARDTGQGAERWSIQDLELGSDYVAAVAVERDIVGITLLRLPH